MKMPVLLFRPPLSQAISVNMLDFDTRHSTQRISRTLIEPGWKVDSPGSFALRKIVIVGWKESRKEGKTKDVKEQVGAFSGQASRGGTWALTRSVVL